MGFITVGPKRKQRGREGFRKGSSSGTHVGEQWNSDTGLWSQEVSGPISDTAGFTVFRDRGPLN